MGLLGLFKRPCSDAVDEMLRRVPRDSKGAAVFLGDVVAYGGGSHRVVAVSHKGKVAVRRVGDVSGKGARWVPASQVERIGGPRSCGA